MRKLVQSIFKPAINAESTADAKSKPLSQKTIAEFIHTLAPKINKDPFMALSVENNFGIEVREISILEFDRRKLSRHRID